MVTEVVLLSLGVFAITNLVKALLPFKSLPPAKLLLVLILSAVLAVVFAEAVREGILMAAGIFGGSTLFHGLHKLLQATGDDRRVAMIQRGIRR